jgi:hypothetical protein
MKEIEVGVAHRAHGSSDKCMQDCEGKRPLGRLTCIWEDNIKMVVKEMV